MPDFTARVNFGVSGAYADWLDPARPVGFTNADDPGEPSRLNPHAGIPHKRITVPVGSQCEIVATIPGFAEGPLDVNCGGRLFYAWAIEWPSAVPGLTHTAGTTSRQRFTVTAAGHYCIGFGRHGGGGAVLFHIDGVGP